MIIEKWDSVYAGNVVSEIENCSEEEFKNLVNGWEKGEFSKTVKSEYSYIRNKISEVFFNLYNNNERTEKLNSQIDIEVGLALYDLFLSNEYRLNITDASNDDLWRFLSIAIFLDITYLRMPKKDRFGVYFSHDRIYKHYKRIWLKQLWWYVHLTWQGDIESTRTVLEKFGPGCFSQILERTGMGYRVDVTRIMLRKIAERVEGSNKVNQKDFRALMMLYYTKMFVVEPTLMDGGIEAFVDRLLERQ